MEGVGFDGEDVAAGEFLLAKGEHGVGEVDGENGGDGAGFLGAGPRRSAGFLVVEGQTEKRWPRFGAVLVEGEGEVAGAAAEVEDDGFGALQGWGGGRGRRGTTSSGRCPAERMWLARS